MNTPIQLPHETRSIFLTDGGLETTLVFHHGIDLPCFAALDLLRSDQGTELLREYFFDYARLAKEFDMPFVIDTVTWRGSRDWATQIGWTAEELDALNRKAIRLAKEIRSAFAANEWIVCGLVGPRGDGYAVHHTMTAHEAEAYHAEQIGVFEEEGVDLVTAATLNYPEEAIGVARAARPLGLPVVLSFTVETNGDLPSGHSLASAIALTDAETDAYPAFYMINCAHPSHFGHVFHQAQPEMDRVRGLRLNASAKSHAELDESAELDSGDPEELARSLLNLLEVMPQVCVVGGCCGTDLRHLGAFGRALYAARSG